MKPTSPHLTWSALSAVLRLQQAPETVDMNHTVESVRVALNELILREDSAFFDRYRAAGRRLAEEGRRALGGADPPPPLMAHDDRDAELAALTAHNAAIVESLSRVPGAEAAALAERIVEWELTLYQERTRRADSGLDAAGAASRLSAERFQAYLREEHPEYPNARVLGFRLQPGGYSKITVLVDCEDDRNGRHGMVLRAQPARRMLELDGMEISLEYPLLRFVHAAGLPVAEPLFLETDESRLGMRFMASRRMPGAIIGTYKGSDRAVDRALLKDVIALMVRIADTQVDPRDPLIQASYLRRWMGHESLRENTRALIHYWQNAGIAGNAPASSLIARGVSWLLANVPEEEARPRLIHGDLGFHNILFDGDRLSALLDWENARFGDPAEELSLFISASAGQASREQIIEWYRDAGGPEISDYRLRYFDVFHCVKVVISAFVSLQRVDEDPPNSLNLAVFGLQYLYFVASRLNELIHAAEAARGLRP